jgi:chemotaxis protein MotA
VKRLARIYRTEGAPALERAAQREADPFLRVAVERVLEGAELDELRDALLGEARRFTTRGEEARMVLLTLGKLFPAFGLIGTLLGLALMLPSVAGGDAAAVAPGLGVAILTTLYGAVLSNVVVLPIATKLHSSLARRGTLLQMIVLGAELLHGREYPTRIERALRSFAGLAPLAASRAVTVLADRAA